MNASPVAPAVVEPSAPTWPVLAELIRTRRSIRRYAPAAIDRAVLEELLTAATWAPSAHNRQPWRFCVVTGDDAKQRLAAVLGARWRADLSADGADPAEVARRVAVSYERITTAAALVIACVSMADMDVYPDPARQTAEWTMAVQSVALACQNLLLAAHAHGLGACWMCAPLFAPDRVRAALDLPAEWTPQALITLGVPAETKTKERAPLAACVVWR